MSADEWEQEMVNDRVEQERIQAIQAYNKSLRADRTSEDNTDIVDTTPLPIQEAEPTYMSAPVKSAKKTAIKTKKRIKKSVKNQAR
jgi:hypothetical protein